MSKTKSAADFIFLTRPILLIPVWAFLLLGYYRAGGERFYFNTKFILIFIIYSILAASVYILNQITDIRSDTINRKHLLLAEGILSKRDAYMEIAVLLIMVIILSFFLNFHFLFFIAVSFIMGIIYSVPPFKFKDRPILDFLINAIGYGFLNFSVGWLCHRGFTIQTVIFSLPYIFGVAAIFINTTILDTPGDELSGGKTTGIFLGRKWALRLSLIFILCSAIVSLILKDWVCFIPAVVSLPLFLYSSIKMDNRSIFLSIGIGGPLLILLTGIVFPYFFILALITFIFLRIYYRHRFNINYPSLQMPWKGSE